MFFFSFLLSFLFFKLKIKLWLPKTPASFPTKRDIRHRIQTLATTFSVLCRFCSSFFICQFYANCYHCCVNECPIQLTHVTYRIALNWSPTFFFSNFRIESWRRRTPVSILTRRALLLTFQVMFNTRYLTLTTTFSVPWVSFCLFWHLSLIRLLS